MGNIENVWSIIKKKIGELFNANIICGKILCCKCNGSDIFKFVLIMPIIISATIVLIFSLKMNFDSEVTRVIAKEFIDNFESTYFLDFQKCNQNDNKVIFDIWPGTNKGCGKNDTKEAYIPKDKNSCKKSEIIIDGIPPQNIDIFNGLSICGTTEKLKGHHNDVNDDKVYDDYYHLLFSDSVVKENDKCPEGTKNCGYIDTVKNKLCLKNTSSCPVSFIEIRDINSPPPPGITNLKVITGETIKFYYSNDPYANSSKIPYIKNAFKIAEDEICALPNLYHSNVDKYVLEVHNDIDFSKNCVLKDYSLNVTIDKFRYSKLNSINHFKLYEENGIIDIIKARNLTEFGYNIERYKENKLNLYVRPHFGFNVECLNNRETKFDIKELTEIIAVADNMKVAAEWLLGVSIGVIAVAFGLESFSFDCSKAIDITVESLFSFGFTLYELYDILKYGITYDDPYETNMNCSDFVSNSNYNVMIEKIQDNGSKIFICCISLIFLAFFTLLFFILAIIELCYKKDKCCCTSQNTRCCQCCVKCFESCFKREEETSNERCMPFNN